MAIDVDAPKVELRACGMTFVARMPTLAELNASRTGNVPRDARRLVNACIVSPAGEDRAKALLSKAGLHIALAQGILSAFGRDSASLIILDEDEIDDKVMADAYVANVSTNKVHALTYTRRGVTHRLLTRDLRGPEVDRFAGGVLPMEEVRGIICGATLWGDAKAIEHSAPGLYLTIADYLVHESGITAEVEEGEYVG